MTLSSPQCVVPSGDVCGEGAVWHPQDKALYWTDINRFLIHRYHPETKSTQSWFFDEPVVMLARCADPRTLLVGLASRIIFWQPETDQRQDFAIPEENFPHARLNDGRVDPAGNLWVGSMFNNVGPDGCNIDIHDDMAGKLYRIQPDGKIDLIESDIGISNTLCWSPAHDKFYFADSLRNRISVYDYDLSSGTISGKRDFFADYNRGVPDGSAIDSEGYLWNARYEGRCVVRLSPAGEIDRIVELPCEAATTCAFGGEDLKTLYITTARAAGKETDRLAGGLFSLAVDVPGLSDFIFTPA